MIDPAHSLPLARQAKALGISRGSVYYLPRPASAIDLAVMRAMDQLHLQYPFAGSRMLRDMLRQEGFFDRALACCQLDEEDGDRCCLSAPEHVQAGTGSQDLSLFAAQAGDCASQPGLGNRHQLHSDGQGFCVSGRHC